MSNIEGITSTNPFGNNDTIAKVNITQNGYLPIATFPNSGQYILSAYIKADKSTEIRFLMNETSEMQRMNVSNSWKELEIPITANTNDELILRLPTNTYYLYNWKIEEGNKATTYTVAPEDTDEQIDELNVQYSEVIQTINSISATVGKHTTEISNKADNSTVTEVKNQVSQLTLDLNGFRTEVSDTYTTKTESQQIQSNIDSVSDNLASFSNSISKEIEDLQNQLDGSITTWFYEGEPTLNNEPAVNWTTTEEKNNHIGDIYYDTITGYSYRFQIMNNQYLWHLLADSDVTKALEMASKAQDTADSKRRVFVETPYPPYEVGDLWVGNTSSELMRCKTERLTGNYSSSDWEKAVKYTDDTTANAVKNNLETNYSTTAQMNSAIEQTASSIKTEVSSTYATKSSVTSDIKSAVDGIEIGGRNIFIGSAKYNDWYSETETETDYISVKSGKEITVSLERRVTSGAINTTYCIVKEYDSDKNELSEHIMIGALIPLYSKGSITFKSTSNTAYVKLVFREYIYFRHIKVEYGNKATDWTEAPEDVDKNIESVRTVATQTADQFSWLVESGTSSTNFVLTDRTAELVAKIISLNGDVKVNGDMLVDGAVTAEKISVKDLVALGATIGGWDMTKQYIFKQQNAYVPPNRTHANKIKNYILGTGTLTNAEKKYFDLNADGTVDLKDAFSIQQIARGLDKYETKAGAVTSPLVIKIDSTSGTKTIVFTATNPLGETIESFIGVNSCKFPFVIGDSVYGSTVEGAVVETTNGANLDTLNSKVGMKTQSYSFSAPLTANGFKNIKLASNINLDGYKLISTVVDLASTSILVCSVTPQLFNGTELHVTIQSFSTESIVVAGSVKCHYVKSNIF